MELGISSTDWFGGSFFFTIKAPRRTAGVETDARVIFSREEREE